MEASTETLKKMDNNVRCYYLFIYNQYNKNYAFHSRRASPKIVICLKTVELHGVNRNAHGSALEREREIVALFELVQREDTQKNVVRQDRGQSSLAFRTQQEFNSILGNQRECVVRWREKSELSRNR